MGDIAASVILTQDVSHDLHYYSAHEFTTGGLIPCDLTESNNLTQVVSCNLGHLQYMKSVSIITEYYPRKYIDNIYRIDTTLSTTSKLSGKSNTSYSIAVPVVDRPALRIIG